MSRSVTVAVAYIMSITDLTWKDALKVIRNSRSIANPNLGFQKQLQDFENYFVHEERRRLRERYPSLALKHFDIMYCNEMLKSYDNLLTSKSICEGRCRLTRQSCPTGVCNRKMLERHTNLTNSRSSITSSLSSSSRTPSFKYQAHSSPASLANSRQNSQVNLAITFHKPCPSSLPSSPKIRHLSRLG